MPTAVVQQVNVHLRIGGRELADAAMQGLGGQWCIRQQEIRGDVTLGQLAIDGLVELPVIETVRHLHHDEQCARHDDAEHDEDQQQPAKQGARQHHPGTIESVVNL